MFAFRPFVLALALWIPAVAFSQDADSLVIVEKGTPRATIVVSAKAGKWEKEAAEDLAKYVGIMSGAKLPIAAEPNGEGPVIFVGEAALAAASDLREKLKKIAKKEPFLRADAIVLERRGNRVFVAGTNDDSHYYAVAELLERWGCRWYLPTDFGACIPEQTTLAIGKLSFAYAPPFEVRSYWLAWNASGDDYQEFSHRNRMNPGVGVPSGHAIGEYVKELIPKGKSVFNVPIAEDATADLIAKKIEPVFAAGKDISLGMEDGIYESASPLDKKLRANLFDKYFLVPSLTDPFLVLYNKVAERLLKQHPNSKSHIGFLAYSNITIPPQRKITAAKPLVAYLAAIDVDPIHGMDDPKSPPRGEYRDMMYRWSAVMQGRVVIYDYDQGMLVWRDMPNPSIASIRQDVKHYKKAGILGISTETRGAMATTFLNFYVRGQLYWNPEADVDAMLAEFYERFYGPSAKPMAAYWTAINDAWEKSIVTEHELYVAPAIYTPELVTQLRKHLESAEAMAKPGTSRQDQQYADRLKFTRKSFEVIDAYMAMAKSAATDADYKAATAAGERGLKARLELAAMNPTFTTRVVGVAAETDKSGPAWWPGEVQQYRELQEVIDGSKGKLVAKLPLEWAFRVDPTDTGVVSGWAYKPLDLKDPKGWGPLRTDLYMQAQGVLGPMNQSYMGHAWYRTELDVTADQAKRKLNLRFPGLFNECWLYVNGHLVAHREQNPVWWNNDYKFEWDVDLADNVKAGSNSITLRVHNPHHFGGMFRRPFVYSPTK
ncbi:MAG: DUF4838 domain-containing protein [Gemmataceae bacterium]|nr:DUF4838 domain-containing protein [Gemmataceae bacterium]